MTMFDNKNWARDMLLSSSLNQIFDLLEEQDDSEETPAELLNFDHVVVQISPEVVMVIKLPDGAEHWTEMEFESYMDQLIPEPS